MLMCDSSNGFHHSLGPAAYDRLRTIKFCVEHLLHQVGYKSMVTFTAVVCATPNFDAQTFKIT